MAARGNDKSQERTTRIAIVDEDKCKPKNCKLECRKGCPVIKVGKECITIEKIASISEELCLGCGICVKKCPYNAIRIINLPSNLEKETVHRYGPNSFKLHRLPIPRRGEVLGLVGSNGTGKSTTLKILANKLKPNLGRLDCPPEWDDIIHHFRGNELQAYLEKVVEGKCKSILKPQYVDAIPKTVLGYVGRLLSKRDVRGIMTEVVKGLDLEGVLTRKVPMLSGGELQRFAIAATILQNGEMYMFDEPSSYLDVKQRLNAANIIRSLLSSETYVLVVEHDLAILDYLSDYIHILYGQPSAYGVVTAPFSVREGINIFLDGFIPTENLRFRNESLSFKIATDVEDIPTESSSSSVIKYPKMSVTLQGKKSTFTLHVNEGNFSTSQITVMLGENGTGKTTFIRLLAGLQPADDGYEAPKLKVSYKPQKISPSYEGTVRQLLFSRIKNAHEHPQFQTDVAKPLSLESILDNEVKNLSGGELQRVALVLCLGKPADVYLIDEPSAYLDSEQRIIVARIIKRFILHSKKTAFVVEHDFIMATYLADRVIVYTGIPSVEATATSPQSLLSGMNIFLHHLDITFRRDPTNFRPRINKLSSVKDREQKSSGNFFFTD